VPGAQPAHGGARLWRGVHAAQARASASEHSDATAPSDDAGRGSVGLDAGESRTGRRPGWPEAARARQRGEARRAEPSVRLWRGPRSPRPAA
jgi:hypothetical protein